MFLFLKKKNKKLAFRSYFLLSKQNHKQPVTVWDANSDGLTCAGNKCKIAN